MVTFNQVCSTYLWINNIKEVVLTVKLSFNKHFNSHNSYDIIGNTFWIIISSWWTIKKKTLTANQNPPDLKEFK